MADAAGGDEGGHLGDGQGGEQSFENSGYQQAGTMAFVKGQSGNPGGRPKVLAEVRELAREHAPEAIQTLATIMADPAADNRARIAAAVALLDRGHGRPTQELTQHIDDQRILLRTPDDRAREAESMSDRLRAVLGP